MNCVMPRAPVELVWPGRPPLSTSMSASSTPAGTPVAFSASWA
jgi:hypothetical protein